ncbi:MAG TPA: AzlC family ABC transporter permease [Thermoleophilaceae bacterium]|jgi:4-azaleucine resistance transporter AzlC
MGFWQRYGVGVRTAVPFAVAVGVFGVSFGVLARDAGMGPVAPVVMSILTFAGSAQFAVVSVLTAGGGVAAACVAALLLNGRYVPIGMSAAKALCGNRLKRVLEAQVVVDESWALSNQGGGRFDRGILIGAGSLLYLAWLLGTAVGVFAGNLIGDPNKLGLDAAFPALFLALLVGQLHSRRAVVAALGGAAIALVVTPFTKPGLPLIAACLACAVGWRLGETEEPTWVSPDAHLEEIP